MGCADCIKIIVFSFNFLLSLVGIALISVGAFYKLHLTQFTNAIPQNYAGIEIAPILTISVGVLIFAIAFFGCCGVYQGSSCLLATYATILLAIFIAQIAIGVYAFLEVNQKKEFESHVNRTIEKVFNNYNKSQESREFVDLMQQELECCGTNGTKYWEIIPKSCCQNSNCKNTLYTNGCEVKFYEFLYSSLKIIGITILSLSAIEVIGSILSLCLANSIRNENRRNRYM